MELNWTTPKKKLWRIRLLVKFKLMKTAATLLKKKVLQRCYPVSFAKIFRKDIFRNTSGRVPLDVITNKILVDLIIALVTFKESIAIIILQITCSQLTVKTLHLRIVICVQSQQKKQQNEVNRYDPGVILVSKLVLLALILAFPVH